MPHAAAPGSGAGSHARSAAPYVERVSTLELFFDLVFVFTITQTTHLVGHAHRTLDFLRGLLVLAVVWWMYGGYAWLTSNIGTSQLVHRLLMLCGMAGFLVMAFRIPETAGRHGPAFGIAYLVVVLVHAVLFTRAPNTSAHAIVSILPFNLALTALVLASGLVPASWNWVPWVGAGLAIAASTATRRESGFQLSPSHFAERHGAVVLIAIGESVVAIGVGATAVAFRWSVVLAAVLGFALAAGIWWCYFDRDDARAERALTRASGAERARAALYAYYHAHFVMIAGIVVAAAGVQGVVADSAIKRAGVAGTLLAGVRQRTASAEWLLAAGVAVYLLGELLFRRLLRVGPIGVRLAAAVLALATAPLGRAAGSLTQLATLVVLLVAMLVVEQRLARGGEPEQPYLATGWPV